MMEYITDMLGVKVIRKEWKQKDNLPYFLINEYDFEEVLISDVPCLFIRPKERLAVVNTVKKHLNTIKKVCSMQIVFEFDKLTRQKRKSFIENKIPFVVKDRQIYLPFMGIVLQENCDSEVINSMYKNLLPSAQMILFAFIYNRCKPLYVSEVAKKFDITAMSALRAATQLVELGLVEVETDGRSKVLYSYDTPKNLFDKAKPYLINPVRKVLYINKEQVNDKMFLSGFSALSELSMLNPPQSVVYGTVESIKSFDKLESLIDTEKQCALEFWKYDTTLLSKNKCADILSLVICMENLDDDRTLIEIEELLEKVWECEI